jgi:hypothetical protein
VTEPAPRLLYRPGDAVPARAAAVPSWAADLRLDELVPALGHGDVGRGRLAVLLTPLPDEDAVAYRQEVFADVERPALAEALQRFAESLAAMRADLDRSRRMRHLAERDRWVLHALEAQDAAVEDLAADLRRLAPASRALHRVGAYLDAMIGAPAFTERRAAVADALAALGSIAFRLRIGEHRVVVSAARDEPDLAASIRATFARLRDGEPEPLPVDRFESIDMSPLEADVLERVARLFPEPFERLARTVTAHGEAFDPALAQLADDGMWYVAVLEALRASAAAGARLAYPVIASDGRLDIRGIADLLVARRLLVDGRHVDTSDLRLAPGERVAIITGPSQGGRTSFARAVGQVHVLAAAGCPVPAVSVTVPLIDQVQTVFDQTERLDDPGGRLRTELRRIRAMLDAADARTLVIANEPFASTTASDALALARRLLARLAERGARVVAVTFLEELADDAAAVSVASVPAADDPRSRTYRFERRPADGLAHAHLLAGQYGLGAAAVEARIRS